MALIGDRPRVRLHSALIAIAFLAALFEALRHGGAGSFDYGEVLHGLFRVFGAELTLSPTRQAIFEWHVWRVLTVASVGGALALSGALLQGVFRNALAAPSVIGVSGGAGLFASAAILLLGGYGPTMLFAGALDAGPWFIATAAFMGGLCAAGLVLLLASSGGRFPVPLLILTGLAVNAVIGGLVAVLHSIALEDWQVGQALFSWGFGHFEDKEPLHALVAGIGLFVPLLIVPFVARELDLIAGGEDDARALGVSVVRVRILALVAASFAAALSVAVVGQIGFVGLIIPHLVRLVIGSRHQRLLWVVAPAGATFLLLTEILRQRFLAEYGLRPGAMMALIGGPAFIVLLLSTKRSLRAW